MITAMLAQLFAVAGRASQLLSCDSQGRLYTATTDAVRCADTRHISRDPQVGLLALCLTDPCLEEIFTLRCGTEGPGKDWSINQGAASGRLWSQKHHRILHQQRRQLCNSGWQRKSGEHSHALICVMYLLLSVLMLSYNRTQIAPFCS